MLERAGGKVCRGGFSGRFVDPHQFVGLFVGWVLGFCRFVGFFFGFWGGFGFLSGFGVVWDFWLVGFGLQSAYRT